MDPWLVLCRLPRILRHVPGLSFEDALIAVDDHAELFQSALLQCTDGLKLGYLLLECK
jgi:hypothetical protein